MPTSMIGKRSGTKQYILTSSAGNLSIAFSCPLKRSSSCDSNNKFPT